MNPEEFFSRKSPLTRTEKSNIFMIKKGKPLIRFTMHVKRLHTSLQLNKSLRTLSGIGLLLFEQFTQRLKLIFQSIMYVWAHCPIEHARKLSFAWNSSWKVTQCCCWSVSIVRLRLLVSQRIIKTKWCRSKSMQSHEVAYLLTIDCFNVKFLCLWGWLLF